MTVTLKPCGRGNWSTLTMRLDGHRGAPLLLAVGQIIDLAGLRWRIASIGP